jgi:hypothetical protein
VKAVSPPFNLRPSLLPDAQRGIVPVAAID